MRQGAIRLTVILGLVSLISIVLALYYWVNKSIAVQERNIAIQQKRDSLNLIHFTEQVHIALKNTLEEISTHISDSSDLYGAVKQISENYFSVDINEELHPYYLENMLKREFYAQNIKRNFQYGIYDCFTDSIVFGNLITFTEDSLYNPKTDTLNRLAPQDLKWEKKDGHYFTVYFPTVSADLNKLESDSYSPWWALVICILPLLFFSFSITIILKQKRLSDIKNDFINNMTHELKTPISTIGLSSEMLMKGSVSNAEDVIRYAGVIYKENKRLQNQVERVLNIAKMDKEQVELKFEPFDIHELIEEARDTFEFNQMTHGGHIYLELNATNSKINGDAVHIGNVIYNLIDNAVKYSNEQPEVHVRTLNDKKHLIFEVTDNGIGIKKEDQKMIFDKFFRVSTGNLHNVKGFGLGLYYVKLVVDAHNGTIEVKSTFGKGTTFRILLPLSK